MILTEADRKRMGTPHRDLRAALEKSPFPDLSNGNPNASVQQIRHARAEHLKKLRHLYPIPGPIPVQVREADHYIPTRDGQIRVRIYTPARANVEEPKARPVIVMFHEGGWRMGDLSDEDLNCRFFARSLGAVCVNVEYRLAPEHPFPAGIHDAYDAVRWCAQNASPTSPILPAEPRTAGFLVGGSSAGGNFAAVVCQMARDEGLDPPLTGQYLSVPALLDETVVPEKWRAEYRSRVDNVRDPVLKLTPGEDKNQRRLDVLKVAPQDPRYSPLLHENLKGLPPAFFQIAGLDPLRDEGLLYERELGKNGTPTRLEVYDGFGHMFWTNWPLLPDSETFVQDTLKGIKWLLKQQK